MSKSKANVATGTARATAAPTSCPVKITNAVPIIAPEVIYGGLLAPIGTAPKNISYSRAPTFIPKVRSPSTSPTKGATIIGRFIIVEPIKLCI